MNLPIEAISEFQEIYQRKCGEKIGLDEAGVKAENFLRLMMLITRKNEDENEKLYKDTK